MFLFWPDMKEDINEALARCDPCSVHCPSKKKDLMLRDRTPCAPMDVVFSDLFEHRGHHYLVVVDAFASFLWVARFISAPTSQQVIHAL